MISLSKFSQDPQPKTNNSTPVLSNQFDSSHQAITQLRLLGRNETHPWSIIKVNNNIIYAYNLVSDEFLSLRQPNKETKRWIVDKTYPNGLRELTRLANAGKELFLIPNHIPFSKSEGCLITKEGVSHANSLFAEIDDCPIDQQWERLKGLEESLGLKPSLVVFSGGKSLHVYFKLSQPLTDQNKWESLQQKLIFALRSDIAIANFNREMRLAGFIRKAKGNHQQITHIDESVVYSVDDIEAKLDSFEPKFTPERYNFFSYLQQYERQRKSVFNVSTEIAYSVADEDIQDEHRRYKLYFKAVRDGKPNPEQWLTARFPEIRKETKRQDKARKDREDSYTFTPTNNTGYGNIYAYFASQYGWFFEHKQRNDEFVRCQCPVHNDQPNHEHSKDSVFISRHGDSVACAQGCDSNDIRDWLRKRAEEAGDPLALAKFEGNDSAKNLAKQLKLNYNREKRYTPDKTFHIQWMGDALDQGLIPYQEREMILAIKAGLGRGKTRMMKSIINEFSNEGWLLIGHRNPLLKQTCRDLGFRHHHSIEKNYPQSVSEEILSDPTEKIGITFDSMHKIPLEALEGRNILLDETTAGLAHLLCAGTDIKRHHQESLDYFKQVIERADRVYCLDGLMTDAAVDYLTALDPYKRVTKIENTYKQPLKFTQLTGTVADGAEGIKKSDSSQFLKEIFSEEHLQNETPVIISDSKMLLLAMDEKLKSLGKRGLIITGDTDHDDPNFNLFMIDPNEYIRTRKPEYLLFNSSCQDGLDINIKGYFTVQYAFFFGVIGVDSAYQMMLRIRDANIPRYFWSKVFATNFETTPSTSAVANLDNKRKALLNDLVESFGADNYDELKVIVNQFDKSNPTAKHWAHIQAIKGYEQRNYRESLVDLLEKSGHKVESFTGHQDLEIIKDLKDAKKAVQDRYCEMIKNAKKISFEEVDQYRKQQNLSSQLTLKRYYLTKQLPGIDNIIAVNTKPKDDEPTEVNLFELECHRLVYGDPKLLSQLRNFWTFHNLDDAKKIHQQQWGGLKEGDTSVFHIRTTLSKIIALKKALESAGIKLDPEEKGKLYHKDSREVIAFLDECKKDYWVEAWGRKPSKKTYSQPMRWLTNYLGYIGYGLGKRREIKIEGVGDQVPCYPIDYRLHRADNRDWFLAQLVRYGFELKLHFLDSRTMPENEQNQPPKFLCEKTPETSKWRYFEEVAGYPINSYIFNAYPATGLSPLPQLENKADLITRYLDNLESGALVEPSEVAKSSHRLNTAEVNEILRGHGFVVVDEQDRFIYDPF